MRRFLADPRCASSVAVVVRWLFCFVVFPTLFSARSTVGTQYYFDSYREIASALLVNGEYTLGSGGPPALHRPPGYVALLLLCDPLAPAHSFLLMQLLHGLLGGAAAWWTWRAALAWGVARRGALMASWLVTLWPFAIWETKVSVPENLLIALVPLLVLVVAKMQRSPGWAAAAGSIAAGIALTHASWQAVLLPLLVCVVLLPIVPRRRLLAAVLLTVTFAAPLLLWEARNARYGYAGLATGFGYHFLKGEYAYEQLLNGKPYFRDHDANATAAIDLMLRHEGLAGIDTNEERSNPRINRALDARARARLIAHPLRNAVKMVVKMPLAWIQQQSAARSACNALLVAPLVVLAIRGVRRSLRLWPLALIMVLMNAAVSLVFVEAIPMRYMLPLLPLLAILAGAGLRPESGD